MVPAAGSAPSVEALVAEAARQLAADDPAAAVATLADTAACDPEYMPLHFVTALAVWSLGDLAKALTLARDCHERDPMNGTVAEVVASLYAQIGDMIESLYFGKLATALKPDPLLVGWLPHGFPSFDKAFLAIEDRPLLTQARALLSQGDLRQGLDKARQHVEVAPADDEGRCCFAEGLLRAGGAGLAAGVLQPLAESGAMKPLVTSLYASALAQIGEAAAAGRRHDDACGGAPRDAGILAARIADARWLACDPKQVAAWAAEWLAQVVPPVMPRRWRAAAQPLVIGYLVANFADRRDAAAVGAVARAHARSGATVVGYGLGAQSWEENAALRGAFDKWRDIAGLDPATLARTLATDGVHVVVDAGGFAAPSTLQALTRVNSAVRVHWLGEGGSLGGAVYDATLSTDIAAAGQLPEWPLGSGYPLSRDWSRRIERSRDQVCRFGADAYLCQIDAATIRLWRAALEAVPHSALLLRANDMAGPNIDRLVERVGRDFAARIDVVSAAQIEDFYGQVDVALTPILAASPRMAAEAIACEVPVLTFADGGAWQPYAGLLRHWGLADFVATTEESYVKTAASLAAKGERWEAASAAVRAATVRGEASAADIATAIESNARATLAKVAA
jgi:tetratricopeptide (TPR) repeat protein